MVAVVDGLSSKKQKPISWLCVQRRSRYRQAFRFAFNLIMRTSTSNDDLLHNMTMRKSEEVPNEIETVHINSDRTEYVQHIQTHTDRRSQKYDALRIRYYFSRKCRLYGYF